jgi:hypothetical protein
VKWGRKDIKEAKKLMGDSARKEEQKNVLAINLPVVAQNSPA